MTRPAFPAEDFYQVQLRLGTESLQDQKYGEAIDQLRIAAFGLLDRPEILSEALAKLALAQTGAGRTRDAKQTIDRFVDVEQHFHSYEKAAVEPAIRKDFDALLLKTVPPEVRTAVPTLATIGPSRMDEINSLSPRERRKALEAEAAKDPQQIAWPLALAREAASRRDQNDVIRYTSRALDIDAKNVEALALRGRARFTRRDYSGALEDLTALPPSSFDDDALAAARFVAAVEMKQLKAAADYSATLSEAAGKRPEVIRARSKLDAATQPQKLKAPASAAPAVAPVEESREPTPSPRPAPPVASAPATKPALPPLELTAPVEARDRGQNSFTVPPPAPSSAVADDAIARSRRLVAKGRYTEAQKVLYDALRKDSGRRDLRLAFLEASALARDWNSGSAQVALVQPFRAGEEPSMFYAAVSYYELGKVQEARVLLRLALPGLAQNEMVDRYAKRILLSGD